jgi:hypothetical protein
MEDVVAPDHVSALELPGAPPASEALHRDAEELGHAELAEDDGNELDAVRLGEEGVGRERVLRLGGTLGLVTHWRGHAMKFKPGLGNCGTFDVTAPYHYPEDVILQGLLRQQAWYNIVFSDGCGFIFQGCWRSSAASST